jgi:hypothetical protein
MATAVFQFNLFYLQRIEGFHPLKIPRSGDTLQHL